MAIAIYEKKIVVTEASIDILGHVNNREYLRWMEEVAIEHSAALGWPQERYMAEQHVWVAREHWIEYLRPALLGDHLSVYTGLQETAGPICLRRYAVVRGRTVLTRAATEWAHIDFKTKRAVMPPDNLINDFPVVPADSPELKALGLARPVRWLPVSLSERAGN